MSNEVLQILNSPEELHESIRNVIAVLKARTGFDAVGIRLQDGDDFPYCAQTGFSEDFLLKENSLIGRTRDGGVCLNCDGSVCLECTCGLVLSDKTDPANPLFTSGGSFWTSDSFPLLDLPPDIDPRLHPRNECIHQGYASFALVPIRDKNRIFGLIQFNSHHKGCFTLESVELLEGIATHVGAALMRKKADDEKLVLEQQFQQAQKLESLGVLAGGIAHDFNNILAIIIGYCALIKMDYENAETHIPAIETAAGRAAELCRQMLAYAGKATLSRAQVDMRMLLDEMIVMLKSTISKNVLIKSELSIDIPMITGDESQLRQVVMNLIINASEAIGDVQGDIQVSLAISAIKAGQSDKDYLGKIIPAGHYLCLEVSDTGCGMDDETKRKIFEPFYSTKFSGRGLGMSVVLGIITAHSGALQLTSQPGQGTSFKVYLPAQSSICAGEEPLQQLSSIAWQGCGTILLVDDEEQVQLIASALLKKLGFTVIGASNGQEALEVYRKNTADITMVITDIGMPVMDGYALIRELKTLDPELPIIITSGFGDTEVASKISPENIAWVINKPYSFDQLREVLKGVVENL